MINYRNDGRREVETVAGEFFSPLSSVTLSSVTTAMEHIGKNVLQFVKDSLGLDLKHPEDLNAIQRQIVDVSMRNILVSTSLPHHSLFSLIYTRFI